MILALAAVNIGFLEQYELLLSTKMGFFLQGVFNLEKPIILWINDGLMSFFFLLVGLEIKREAVVGELSNVRLALLPLAAAIGGMVVPALLYLTVTWGTPAAVGWGIPMATDIAFALGVLALMGPHVPLGLKIFLTALAIVDDLGAVLVISVFYTTDLALGSFWMAAASFAVLLCFNLLQVRSPVPYMLVGVVLWYFLLKSGVHATVSGVLLAWTIPAGVKNTPQQFIRMAKSILDRFSSCEESSLFRPCVLKHPEQHTALMQLEALSRSAETPLQRIEHNLVKFVSFVVVPVFAMANAGIFFGSGALEGLGSPASVGVLVGLFIGKPLGIAGATWVMVRLGVVSLPRMVTMGHIVGAGCLAGIGFTMSLFVNALAFSDQTVIDQVKLSILVVSILSWTAGWFVLNRCPSCVGQPKAKGSPEDLTGA